MEFALLAPTFILFFLGMTAYGIHVGASHSVQQIAAEVARAAISGRSEAERRALAADFVRFNAGGYSFVDPRKLSVEARDPTGDGTRFVVAVRYDATALPLWNLLNGLPLPGRIISRQSTIRIGGI
ncbi:TadE/TadG family type IV pilus assembly protein [Mesorhizobium sp. KR1-2]|uniref:TadE/TadG family type IV pilus assembly protein n=1 Tax=Mesorhizobium sp. KR1-2 TaxID=3156609 RepID=UPI0032B5EAFC